MSNVTNIARAFGLFTRALLVAVSLLLLSACAEEDPAESGKIHLERAKAYQDQGQYKAAIIEYKNAIKKSDGDLGILVAYAEMLNELSLYSTAHGLLENYSGDKNERYYLVLIEALIGMNKFASAKEMLEAQSLDSMNASLLEAKILLGLNNLPLASSIYESILLENPKSGDAIIGKVSLLLRQEKMLQAKALLSSIENSSPAFLKARILISSIQIAEDKLEEAETTLSDALSLLPNTDMMQPEKALVLERLSYVLTRLGRSNEAYIYTRLLAEAFPGVNEMNEKYSQAVEKFKAGDIEGSQVILTELITDFPGYIKANQLLGVVSYLQGNHEQALAHFSGRVDPEVADPLATQLYVASSLKMNEPKKVLELLEDTIEQSDKADTIALYALAAISDKQYSKGEKAILRAIRLAPDNYKLHLLLAAYHREKPEPSIDQELVSLKEAYQVAPTELQVMKDLLRHYLHNQKVSEAEAFVEDLLKRYASNYSAQLISGYYFASTGKGENAKQHFVKAMELEPEGSLHRNAIFALGRTELTLGQNEAAYKSFSSLVEKFPNDVLGYKGLFSALSIEDKSKAFGELEKLAKEKQSITAYKVLIQAALKDKNSEKANSLLVKAKRIDKESIELKEVAQAVSLLEAVEALDRKEFTLARELIAPVLVEKPDNLRLLAFLVELEIKAANLQEAEKMLGQIKLIQEDSHVIAILSGDLAMAKNAIDEARGFYEQAWKQNKNEITANKLFQTLVQLKASKDKSNFVGDWVRALPNSINGTLFKAIDDQAKGDNALAKVGYERVLRAMPENTTVLNNLGWLYFEEGDKKSLDLLAKASELAPENPAILDSYGWVLAQFGSPSKGLPYLEKANKLAPDIQEISDHLKQVKAQL